MNKNIIKLFAILMMCFLIGSVLVACGSTNEDDQDVFSVEIVNGNWWINGVDTKVPATGNQGPAGANGLNGSDLEERCKDGHDYDIYYDEGYIEDGNKWEINVHNDLCARKYVEGGFDSTCEKLGEKYFKCNCTIGTLYVCVDCGESKFVWEEIHTEYIALKEHAYVTTPATCTEYAYTTCANGCDYKVVHEDWELADHVAGEKEYVEFANNSLGITCPCEWNDPWIKTCTACGLQVEDGNDGTNKSHVHTNWEPCDQGVVPDCEWIEGTTQSFCDNCDCLEHIEYDYHGNTAPGHKDQAYTDVKIDGDKIVASFDCVDCGEKVTDKFNVADYTITTPATCGQDGSIVVKFQDKVLKSETISKDTVAHTPVAIGVATDKTCTADGKTAGSKCSACGKILEAQEIDKALGHNKGEELAGTSRDLSVIEVSGVKYDAYWCDVCKHWVAYQKHVED